MLADWEDNWGRQFGLHLVQLLRRNLPVERDELISAVWVIAGLVALAPAMLFILWGLILVVGLLRTLPGALANQDGYTLRFIARTIAETFGGCAGLLAAWMGILIPQKLQRRPNLKRTFLLFACAGVAAMCGYIPQEGWGQLSSLRLWIMLGPVVMGFCGLYRVFCSKSLPAIEGPS
jgi:hypothetical protein